MKPRKKWEPEYRFGGNKGSFFYPMPLGTTNGYPTHKSKAKQARKKKK